MISLEVTIKRNVCFISSDTMFFLKRVKQSPVTTHIASKQTNVGLKQHPPYILAALYFLSNS